MASSTDDLRFVCGRAVGQGIAHCELQLQIVADTGEKIVQGGFSGAGTILCSTIVAVIEVLAHVVGTQRIDVE